MVRPCVARGFVELAFSGLASMYPVSDWSCFAPDQYGYQRACDLINGQASTGAIRVTSVRMRREDRSSISSYSSRRPRLETVDRVMSSLAPHFAQFLCSSQVPFLRPGLQNVDRVARRAVTAGRRAWLAAGSGVARLRLIRAEHGAWFTPVGRLHRQYS